MLNFTRRGNTLYMHVYYWPGHTPAAEWLDFYKPEVVVAFARVETQGALGAAASRPAKRSSSRRTNSP